VTSSAQRAAVAPVRFGLVGYGFGARYFHAPLIASATECQLVAVATRSAERRALVATEHPDAAVVDDLAGLVAAGAEAVTVSTPADTHIPLCRQVLERGLPVVVDKPFALTAADARPAVELAERLGLALSVYQNRRWDSDFRTVRALADSGALGEITRFESRFERRQDGPPAAGGGTLLDFGSHLVDQAIQLLGPVRTVYAEIHHRDDPAGLDDDVFVALAHARGAHSHLWGSWVQSAPGPRFRVTGTRATYVVDGLDIQEELLVAGRTPASEAGRGEPNRRTGGVGCKLLSASGGPNASSRRSCQAGSSTSTTHRPSRPSPTNRVHGCVRPFAIVSARRARASRTGAASSVGFVHGIIQAEGLCLCFRRCLCRGSGRRRPPAALVGPPRGLGLP
jgi:predicted dehydrogenase